VLLSGPTTPRSSVLNASSAVESELRSSCASTPRRSVPLRASFSSRWRSYSVTALAMASSRQRLKTRNSSTEMGVALSMASSVTTWHTSP
jgi:hypothetical protein